MNKLLFKIIGFGVPMMSAPFVAWRYPRTDILHFGLMNELAAASVFVAAIFLAAAFMDQGSAFDKSTTE